MTSPDQHDYDATYLPSDWGLPDDETRDRLLAEAWLMHSAMPDVPTERLYHRFEIPKRIGDPSAGVRVIHAPMAALKQLQNKLLAILMRSHIGGSVHAHAYYKGRSIKSMARPHLRAKYLLKVDLSDFFHSVRPNRIDDELARHRGVGLPRELRIMVRRWCYLHGGLPMGAPTSPFLSNVAASALDAKLNVLAACWRRGITRATTTRTLENLRAGVSVDNSAHVWHRSRVAARPWMITYTRYSDDLVFSADYPQLFQLLPAVRAIISSCGFTVNEKKVHRIGPGSGRAVCGVSISARLGKDVTYRREHLRAAIFNASRNIVCGDTVTDAAIQRWSGMIAHVEYLNASQGAPLRAALQRLIALRAPRSEWTPELLQWAAAHNQRG